VSYLLGESPDDHAHILFSPHEGRVIAIALRPLFITNAAKVKVAVFGADTDLVANIEPAKISRFKLPNRTVRAICRLMNLGYIPEAHQFFDRVTAIPNSGPGLLYRK